MDPFLQAKPILNHLKLLACAKKRRRADPVITSMLW